MRLDLRTIINEAGAVSFDYELDLSDMDFVSISEFLTPLRVSGSVVNSAGVLTLRGEVRARLLMICDRCGSEFERETVFPLNCLLAAELQDDENPDIFLLDGDFADLDEIASDAFVLGLESKVLCREDCLGACRRCGKSLNDGPCGCKPETDSRLAVLGQLLSE